MRTIFIYLCSTLVLGNLYTQNVGLGTSTPTRAKFEVNGLVGNTAAIFGGDGAGIGIIATSPEIGFNAYYNAGTRYMNNGYAAIQFLGHTQGYFGFDVHGTGNRDDIVSGPATRRAMTILNNGRVMLGLNSGSDATLNVGQYAGMLSTAYFSGSTFNYSSSEYTLIRRKDINLPIHINYFAPNSKVVFGNGTGLVGINWSIPVYPLEIHSPDFGIGLMRIGSENNWLLSENQAYLKLYFRSLAQGTPALDQKGSFSYIDGSYSPISDERFKKNITRVEPMLDKLMLLRPSEYELIANNKDHYRTIGLIAQDVKDIFPELVHTRSGENSGYSNMEDLYLMNYSSLAPIVIKSLQEQQAMLNELEDKLTNIELQKQQGNKKKQ